jgi:hypothetical protein
MSSSSRTNGIYIGSGIKLKESAIPLKICSNKVITKKNPKIELTECALTVSLAKIVFIA